MSQRARPPWQRGDHLLLGWTWLQVYAVGDYRLLVGPVLVPRSDRFTPGMPPDVAVREYEHGLCPPLGWLETREAPAPIRPADLPTAILAALTQFTIEVLGEDPNGP